jgi:hypothetical protein
MADEPADVEAPSRNDNATITPPAPPWRDEPVTITPPEAPWRDEPVTITCPVCQKGFARQGKRQWCSPACKTEAWRRRHQADRPAVVVPPARPRRPITVYECDGCGARAVGVFSSPSGRETIASVRSAKSCKGFWGWRRKLDVGYRCIARRPMTTDGRTAAEVVIMLAGDPRLVQARRSRDGARWG